MVPIRKNDGRLSNNSHVISNDNIPLNNLVVNEKGFFCFFFFFSRMEKSSRQNETLETNSTQSKWDAQFHNYEKDYLFVHSHLNY